jgi:signal transduction histidine kinase
MRKLDGKIAFGASSLVTIRTQGKETMSASKSHQVFCPDKARLVISISMQFETGAQPEHGAGSPFPPIDSKFADLPVQKWYEYGLKEGIPRLLDLWDRAGVKVPSHMVGQAVEGHPERLTQSDSLARGVIQVLETLPCSAVIEERNRLAREIHDTLVQQFAGILLHLEAVEAPDDAEWCSSSECIARARELAKSGLEDIRRILLNLRPKSLESATLPDALWQLAQSFKGDRTITCTFCQVGNVCGLPVAIQDELYRVAQEALSNVRKHSRATSASLSLAYKPGVIVMKIKDNGQGFATIKHQAAGHGYGMSMMRERARCLGGKININSAPGAGTEVRITVPLPGRTQMEANYQ